MSYHRSILKIYAKTEAPYWESERKYRTQFEIPKLNPFLLKPRTPREKAYLSYIRTLVKVAKEDPMTGFLHKESFMKQIEKKSAGGFFFFIDGDNLKATNAKYGHEAGHATILGIAEGIKGVRPEFGKALNLVTRSGGDEFMLHMGKKFFRKVREWAEFILASINSIPIGQNYQGDPETKKALMEIPISVSIGAGFTPVEAEENMKKAKIEGKNKIVISPELEKFDPEKAVKETKVA